MIVTLGIDPGLSGGLALVSGGGGVARLLDCIDVPTVGSGSKRRVDALAVMQFIRRHPPDFGLIERGQAMPDQGSSSGFNYGRAIGALETCMVGLLIPHETCESRAWKKANGLAGSDKELSRQRAIRLFPDGHHFFARKLDHNRAESALIAWYALQLRLPSVKSA